MGKDFRCMRDYNVYFCEVKSHTLMIAGIECDRQLDTGVFIHAMKSADFSRCT